MNRNVEIKARAPDPADLRQRVEALATEGPTVLDQEDTFFACARGRLKLRRLLPSRAELIFYQRPDAAGPRESRFSIVPVADPEALGQLLGSALGVTTVVRKRRVLYRIGQTRVHLDSVDGLGEFVELEVELTADQSEGDGRAIANRLAAKLLIRSCDLVELAYADLLACGTAPRDTRTGR